MAGKFLHDTETQDLADVRRIVLYGLRNYPAKVYLFGSWAKGKACKTSDIDVAVFPSTPLPPGVLSKIRETLEESRVLYKVDVVDLTATDPLFRRRVLQEGISWND